MWKLLVVASLSALLCPIGLAQGDVDYLFGSEGKAEDFHIDTSMPDYPAVTLLGTADQPVTNVVGAEDLGTHLFNQFDKDGDFKLGVAFAATPYWWTADPSMTLKDYQSRSAAERVLARSQVSFAISELTDGETVSEKTGFNTAIGVSMELLSTSDPRYSEKNRECVQAALNDGAPDLLKKSSLATQRALLRFATTYPDVGLDLAGLDDPAEFIRVSDMAIVRISKYKAGILLEHYDSMEEEVTKLSGPFFSEKAQKGLDACEKKASEELRSKKSLRLGAALAGRSESGRADDLTDDGMAIWLSYRHPFGQKSEGSLSSFGAFLKYESGASESFSGDKIPEAIISAVPAGETPPETVLENYDGYQTGMNLNRVRDDFVVSGALSYVSKNYERDAFSDEDYLLATMTASLKVREGVWVEASFGWADDAKFDAQEFAGVRLKVDWNRLGTK